MRWAHCRGCGSELGLQKADQLDGLCSIQISNGCFTKANRWAIRQKLIKAYGAYTDIEVATAAPWQVAIDMWLEAGKP
jgi:hypothetical protein